MAARDDLFINIGEDKFAMLGAVKQILTSDKDAILASRIFTSLESHRGVSLSDISDLQLMYEWGYRNYLLSDGVCSRREIFLEAISLLKGYERKYGQEAE
jgi:hypothetical protein